MYYIYTQGEKTPFNKKKKPNQTVLEICSVEATMNKESLKKLAVVVFLLLSHICLWIATIANKQELYQIVTSTFAESYTEASECKFTYSFTLKKEKKKRTTTF